jgi:hypothetical protein
MATQGKTTAGKPASIFEGFENLIPYSLRAEPSTPVPVPTTTFGLPPCSGYPSHETVGGVCPKGRRHGDPLAPVSDSPDSAVVGDDVGDEKLQRATLVQRELSSPPSANAKLGDPLSSREIFTPTIEPRVTNAHRP